MQTSSPPVITPNRSQSNPDDMITLPRPIQSVGMDLHDVSGTSTGQTLPRERRAPPGTHFCPTIWWVYPHSATIFILHPLLSTFSSTLSEIYPLVTTLRPSGQVLWDRNPGFLKSEIGPFSDFKRKSYLMDLKSAHSQESDFQESGEVDRFLKMGTHFQERSGSLENGLCVTWSGIWLRPWYLCGF